MIFGSRPTRLLGLGIRYALAEHNEHQVRQLTHTQASMPMRAAALVVPTYTSAYELFEQLPPEEKTIGERLGAVLFPSRYVALKLATQKAAQEGRSKGPTITDVAGALLTPRLYSALALSKLNQPNTQALHA